MGLRRAPVRNKHRSAAKFRKSVGRTKLANVVRPQRGGYRL